MARVFPARIDVDAPEAEVYLFRRFGDALPDELVVFHARRFILPAEAGRPAFEGELDFVILDPGRGLVGLEVKGGGVGKRGGAWYSVDRHGREHPIKDPGLQASRAVHAMDAYLSRQRWFRQNRFRVRFGWGVAFPDVEVTSALGPDLPRQIVIARNDLGRLASAVGRVFEACGVSGPVLPAAAVRAVIEALAPTMHLVKPLVRQLGEEGEALVRLTEEQKRVLDLLETSQRVAIEGAAGSGKTVLAVEKARRLGCSGKKVVLLCFNRPLADFLAASADVYEVQTFHGLCRDLAIAAGLPFQVPDAGEAQALFWEREAPAILLEALDKLPEKRYDAIVVDEGQDFRTDWWVAIEALLEDPGKGELIVFFDPKQNLYGGGPPAALGVSPHRLKWNCRNTSNSARYACDLIGEEARVKPEAPDGVSVTEIECASEREAIDAVRRTLHRLLVEEKLSHEQVVVLSTHNHKRSPLARERNLGPATPVPFGEPLKGKKDVRFASLQRFKGLEADAVILTDVEPGALRSGPTHLYVGATRARHVLVVVKSPAR